MTVEELKKIANEMGYNIIKKQEYIKFLPCKCGHNRRKRWYGTHDGAYIFVCLNCGADMRGTSTTSCTVKGDCKCKTNTPNT